MNNCYKPNNESFKNKIEDVQYKACIPITGAIRGISREHLYYELGLESLGDRQWRRKLTFCNKIVNGLAPKYLTNYLNTNDNLVYKTRASERKRLKDLEKTLKIPNNYFFPFCVKEWYKLDISRRKAKILNVLVLF